jgi:hypothetical protein
MGFIFLRMKNNPILYIDVLTIIIAEKLHVIVWHIPKYYTSIILNLANFEGKILFFSCDYTDNDP